jgi:hypothetical protein
MIYEDDTIYEVFLPKGEPGKSLPRAGNSKLFL